MEKIVVIGSVNVDMVVKTSRLPKPGETVLGGTFFMNAGGKGANQAVAAERLGGNVTFITKVGNDIFGKQAIENFQKEKINTRFIFTHKDEASGAALIIINEEGENCIVVAPGANAHLLPEDIEKVTNLSGADIILMQLEIPLETVVYVVRLAKANRQKVVLNPAPAQNLSKEILDGLFLITPNETEAFLLTGIEVSGEESASRAAGFLLSHGVQNVVITLGEQGAYFQNKELKLMVDAPKVKVLDTTAAGDTFSGAITVAIIEKMNWQAAVEFAVKAASITVTRLGAQLSVPYRSEINI